MEDKPVTIFKPKYTGMMKFAMYLFPLWVGLSVYFIYQWFVTGSFNPQGFLAILFGIMAVSLPFRVFKEMHFGDRITVKRYFLPDILMEYKDIVAYSNGMRLATGNQGISLYMITPDSLDEFDVIIHGLMSARKIKLRKK